MAAMGTCSYYDRSARKRSTLPLPTSADRLRLVAPAADRRGRGAGGSAAHASAALRDDRRLVVRHVHWLLASPLHCAPAALTSIVRVDRRGSCAAFILQFDAFFAWILVRPCPGVKHAPASAYQRPAIIARRREHAAARTLLRVETWLVYTIVCVCARARPAATPRLFAESSGLWHSPR